MCSTAKSLISGPPAARASSSSRKPSQCRPRDEDVQQHERRPPFGWGSGEALPCREAALHHSHEAGGAAQRPGAVLHARGGETADQMGAVQEVPVGPRGGEVHGADGVQLGYVTVGGLGVLFCWWSDVSTWFGNDG